MSGHNFAKEDIKKATISKWKTWLYRFMWWKYKEIENGIFIHK